MSFLSTATVDRGCFRLRPPGAMSYIRIQLKDTMLCGTGGALFG